MVFILKKKCKYEYLESTDNEEYYILKNQIIFNQNKDIIVESKIDLNDINFKNNIKKTIDSIDLNNTKFNYLENVIIIQKWFSTYGHFMDEIFNLFNFYNLLKNPKYKVIMSYSKSCIINYSFDNYDKIKNLLFESNIFINIDELEHKLTKIKNIILIKNDITSTMFHMFPKFSINKILKNIDHNDNKEYNKNIFITRGKALHMPRNLDNQSEIEEHFLSIGYDVINPEIINILDFISKIKDAENIYITWGGSMVNLCFVNPKTKIYLLQSKSYKEENIFNIFKFLINYKNLYIIKCDENNRIDIKSAVPIKL
jgi:hypothetical protein